MKCKDCSNYRCDTNIEAGAELSPNIKAIKGKCDIDNKNCNALDDCGCGGFKRK